MEIELRNVNYYYKNKQIFRDLNIKIDSSSIVGVIGNYKSTFLKIIDCVKKIDGDVLINGNVVNKSNINSYRKDISLVNQENNFFTSTVKDEFMFITKYNSVDKNINKRITDSLKMVKLDESYLNRKINTLSSSEVFLFKLACSLFLNPKVIMIDDGFNLLDDITTKYILNLLKKLNKEKNRLIIIASRDVDLIYSFTKRVIVLNNQRIVRYDDTKEVFCDINFLNNNDIDIPYLVEFTYKAKNKKVKIGYHTDILDLIKDVYKHV